MTLTEINIYNSVYHNLEEWMEMYPGIFEPENNNYTQEMIRNGHDYREAISKSITTTVLLWLSISN